MSTYLPREKLQKKGKNNLQDWELLALILGTGCKTQDVFSLSKNFIHQFNLSTLSNVTFEELCSFPNLGEVKASKIIASIELGSRIHQTPITSFLSPKTVWQETASIHNKQREYVFALYLDARYQLITKNLLAVGSLNQTILEARDVFMGAIQKPCAHLVLVHNHPSGDPTPSEPDLSFTKIILAAGELLGIPLLDHVIVTKNGYYSFRAKGLL